MKRSVPNRGERLRLRDLAGVGPLDAGACALLFAAARALEQLLRVRPLGGSPRLHYFLAGVLLAMAAIVFGACLRDMPLAKHGRTLVTTGIYRYLRHPRYAVVAVCIYPAAALLLHSTLCLASTALALPLVMAIASLEEAKLIRTFGEEYRDYMRATPGFIPRLWPRKR